jgi:hypothetical protein
MLIIKKKWQIVIANSISVACGTAIGITCCYRPSLVPVKRSLHQQPNGAFFSA